MILHYLDKERITFPNERNYKDIVEFVTFVRSYIKLQNNLFDEKEESSSNIVVDLPCRSFRLSNYVGEIIFKNYIFHIFPFSFKKEEIEEPETLDLFFDNLNLFLNDAFNVRFKKINSGNCQKETTFLEILIVIFIDALENLLLRKPYYSYIEHNNNLNSIKGRINFNKYFNNFVNGEAHLINCDYAIFSFNNNINQVLKFVTKKLLNMTKKDSNKTRLKRIYSFFEELSDISLKEVKQALKSIHFNLLNKSYENIILLSKIFIYGLNNYDVENKTKANTNFCFIFRMNVLFEKFITHRLDDYLVKINKYHNYSQYNKEHLFIGDTTKTLKPDNLIKDQDNVAVAILDTKYKSVDSLSLNNISEHDLYQMVIYCLFHKSKLGILLYPLRNNDSSEFKEVTKYLNNKDKEEVKIMFVSVPFILSKEEINKRDFSRIFRCFDAILNLKEIEKIS